MTLIHATIALALALFAANAAAAEPAMLRLGSVCFKSDDPGKQLPCDPRTADADQIAGMEWVIRDNLKTYGDLDDQANLQAWLAATGNTFAERKASFEQELPMALHKLAMQHTSEADQFLDGACPHGDKHRCEVAEDKFRLNYWDALHGNVGLQQQVASCFQGKLGKDWTCEGVVKPDPLLECAWSLVALSSGSPKIRQVDADEYDDECGGRSWSEKQAFFGQASQLFQRIYNRPLPRQP